MVAEDQALADRIIDGLRRRGVQATFHYQALHASPFARTHLGTADLELPLTTQVSDCIVRLPLSSTMNPKQARTVLRELKAVV